MLSIVESEVGAIPEEAVPVDRGEFEIVMGWRQIASALFVGTALVVMFSGASYMAGKSVSPKAPAAAIAPPAPTPVQAAAPAAQVQPAVQPEKPLFVDPQPGALYLQMGAVEKGIAAIFVDGLRKRNFEAFAAPGPNDRIFRVLIGPFASAETYKQAKDALDAIGLDTFARKYQQ